MNANTRAVTAVHRSVATSDASVAPALHRLAGDRARPVTASFGQDFSRVRVHTESAATVRRAAEGGLDLGGLAMEDLADSEPQPVVQTMRDEVSVSRQPVSVSRQPVSVQRHPCPPYDGYSPTFPLTSYNCGGLAHRTYDYKSQAVAKALLSAGVPCAAGKVKHWLWEYDMHLENDKGSRSSPSPDFHTVAGAIRSDGADPNDVLSKNGKRPIYGPGTGPSFRPPARERATLNSPAETPLNDGAGNPLFKVRANYVDTVRCLNCPSQSFPIQGPPPPP